MAESYSVKARLSAVDSGFSSTLKGAVGALDGFKSKLSGISFGMLSGVGQSLFNGLKNGVSDLIGEIDSSNASWKTFESNLSMLSWDGSAIGDAKKDLQEFAQQTVYSSSDMATTFAQLAAVGVDDTSSLVKAFGGLAAAAENPQQAMKTLSQQATQMAAKPEVAWQDFKLMLEQTPAGIAAVAREMGMSTSQLVTKVQEGEISTKRFFDAIKAAGGEGTELAKLATEAKTIGQAMDGLKETIGNKLTPAFDYLSQIGISAVGSLSDAFASIDGETIKNAVVGWIEDAKPMWESFKNAATKVWAVISGVGKNLAPVFASLKSTMGGAVKSVLDQIGRIDAAALASKISSGIEKAKPYWEAIRNVISSVAGVIAKVLPYIQKVGAAIGSFFLDNSKQISKFIPYIAGAIAAFKGFNLVKGIFSKASSSASGAIKSIGGGISEVLKSVGTMIKNIGSGISDVFIGVGKGIESVFVGIGKALQLANPANILAFGAAIAIAAIGFTFLAKEGEGVAKILEGIGAVVGSLGDAIGAVISATINAIAEALVTLAPVLPIVAQSLVMLTPLVRAFGQAFSEVAIALGTAISEIVVAIGEGIALIIEALTPVVEILANLIENVVSILVDAAVRIVEAIAPVLPAFTEAFTKITEVVSNAIVSIIEILAPYIPEITKMVEATSVAIQAICDAFTALVEQISPVIDSITALVKQLGESLTEILGGASELVTAFGDSISEVIDSIGGAISGVIDSIGGVFDSMGEAALNAGKGFEHLADGIKTITKLNLLDMAASMTAVALSLGDLVKKSDGIAAAGKGMSDLTKGLKAASKTGADDLEILGEAAESMVKTMTVSFAKVPTIASASIVAVNAALLAGAARVYRAGEFISIGFANGMRSQLGEIRSAAAEMAIAAQKALEAKAKIDSPSKVTTKDGQWWGQGYANGMMDKVNTVRKAAEKLVSIPQVSTPKLAMSYGGELATDYNYTNNAEYIITVPVTVDGKEVARVTAPYTQAELSRRETRESRKLGKV
jgi:tape measure domain-containing protein